MQGGRLGAGGIEGGPVADADGRYGPIALYAGGSGEARFESVAYKDFNARQFSKEQTSRNWRMQRLSEWYYSYAAAAADLNHDGVMDVVAGPYYYLGPDYTVAKEIYQAETSNPGTQWPVTAKTQIAYDWRGNGWPDVLTIFLAYSKPDPYGPPVLYLYRTVRNPKAPGGAEFVPELIHNRSGVGDHFWVGDLNQDGTPDIVTSGAMGSFIFSNNMKKSAKVPAPTAH
jgi:hypothetical protein